MFKYFSLLIAVLMVNCGDVKPATNVGDGGGLVPSDKIPKSVKPNQPYQSPSASTKQPESVIPQSRPISGTDSWILAFNFDNRSFDDLFSGEDPRVKTIYPYARHMTLAWLQGINQSDPQFKRLKESLQKVVQDFMQEHEDKYGTKFSIEVDDAAAWGYGGIFLKPSSSTEAKLRDLDSRLRTQIARFGFVDKIHPYSKTYDAHITLLERTQASKLFSTSEQASFLTRVKSRIKFLNALPISTVANWVS